MNQFFPEGALLDTPRNQAIIRSAAGLAEAAMEGTVLEARAVLCDAEHNLHVEMPCMEGVIPYFEGAIGIAEGTTRDIALISRVSKPVCFTVNGFEHLPDGRRRAVLSRRECPGAMPGSVHIPAAAGGCDPRQGHPPGNLRRLLRHRLRPSRP